MRNKPSTFYLHESGYSRWLRHGITMDLSFVTDLFHLAQCSQGLISILFLKWLIYVSGDSKLMQIFPDKCFHLIKSICVYAAIWEKRIQQKDEQTRAERSVCLVKLGETIKYKWKDRQCSRRNPIGSKVGKGWKDCEDYKAQSGCRWKG